MRVARRTLFYAVGFCGGDWTRGLFAARHESLSSAAGREGWEGARGAFSLPLTGARPSSPPPRQAPAAPPVPVLVLALRRLSPARCDLERWQGTFVFCLVIAAGYESGGRAACREPFQPRSRAAACLRPAFPEEQPRSRRAPGACMGTESGSAGALLGQAGILNLQTGNLLNWGRLRKKCPATPSEEVSGAVRPSIHSPLSALFPAAARRQRHFSHKLEIAVAVQRLFASAVPLQSALKARDLVSVKAPNVSPHFALHRLSGQVWASKWEPCAGRDASLLSVLSSS